MMCFETVWISILLCSAIKILYLCALWRAECHKFIVHSDWRVNSFYMSLSFINIYLLTYPQVLSVWLTNPAHCMSDWKGVASQCLLPHYLWRSHFCFFILLKIQTCARIKHEPGGTELNAVLGNSLNKNNWLAGGNPVFLLVCETSRGVSLSPNLKWDFAEGFTILSVCTGQDWHSLGHINVALC